MPARRFGGYRKTKAETPYVNTISNLALGRQRSVTRNVVTFLPGDLVNTRLRTEYLSATVLDVPDMAT